MYIIKTIYLDTFIYIIPTYSNCCNILQKVLQYITGDPIYGGGANLLLVFVVISVPLSFFFNSEINFASNGALSVAGYSKPCNSYFSCLNDTFLEI